VIDFFMIDLLLDGVIFQPSPGVDLEPAGLHIEAEELTFESEDAVRIHSFFLPFAGADRAILFLHGNAGNASHRLPNAAQLEALGAHVLLVDYRGYGRSEGKPTESGVYRDARAALVQLLKRTGLSESRVVVFGRSLGGAIAVDLAQNRNLGGLILESTFTSVAEVVESVVRLPIGRLLGNRFASIQKISRVSCPILMFHGDRDEVIPFDLGRRLFEAAPSPKAFEAIPGAGHNDTTIVGGRSYFERIGRFLDQVAPS